MSGDPEFPNLVSHGATEFACSEQRVVPRMNGLGIEQLYTWRLCHLEEKLRVYSTRQSVDHKI